MRHHRRRRATEEFHQSPLVKSTDSMYGGEGRHSAGQVRDVSNGWTDLEVECIPGLEEIVIEDLHRGVEGPLRVLGKVREGRVAVAVRREPFALNSLRSATAVHVVERFDIASPEGLLKPQPFARLEARLREVIRAHPDEEFATFRISAAGSNSPVFVRFKHQLEGNLGLKPTDRGGDLLLSVRKGPSGVKGWEVLIRTSPRPLSVRTWRKCNMPGALNASIAYAMVRLAKAASGDQFINLLCGSGTLLVERLQICQAREAVGVDLDGQALACARRNLAAVDALQRVRLLEEDACDVKWGSASFDSIVADLPFGMLVGGGQDLERLYQGVLVEAGRLASEGASFVLLTGRRRLVLSAIESCGNRWRLDKEVRLRIPFRSGYVSASIFVLTRIPDMHAAGESK